MGLNIFATISVLSIFFIQMGMGIMTPAIQNLAQAFPDVPFTTIMMISTMPSLAMIPSSFVVGPIAEKFGYRPVLIIGMLFFTIGGAMPYFMDNFTMILVTRMFVGVGFGILFPMGNALVLKFYEGQKRANMMGVANVAANIGGISLQMLGAFLCAIAWQYSFLAHLVGIIALVFLIFFLPEPEKAPVAESGEKAKMPMIVFILAILSAFAQMVNGPVLLNMSTIIINAKLGTAASAGAVLAMFTVGGMVGGAVFGIVFKTAGRFTIALGMAGIGLGLGIANFAGSLVMLGCGIGVCGIGLFTLFPACIMELGMKVSPAGVAMATGIFMATSNIGLFASPYYMAFLAKMSGNPDVRFPLMAGLVIGLATAVVIAVLRIKPSPEPVQQS